MKYFYRSRQTGAYHRAIGPASVAVLAYLISGIVRGITAAASRKGKGRDR